MAQAFLKCSFDAKLDISNAKLAGCRHKSCERFSNASLLHAAFFLFSFYSTMLSGEYGSEGNLIFTLRGEKEEENYKKCKRTSSLEQKVGHEILVFLLWIITLFLFFSCSLERTWSYVHVGIAISNQQKSNSAYLTWNKTTVKTEHYSNESFRNFFPTSDKTSFVSLSFSLMLIIIVRLKRHTLLRSVEKKRKNVCLRENVALQLKDEKQHIGNGNFFPCESSCCYRIFIFDFSLAI